MVILPGMDAGYMLLHPRVDVFLQMNIGTAAGKIRLTAIPVNKAV
jgi:hypothetical protein